MSETLVIENVIHAVRRQAYKAMLANRSALKTVEAYRRSLRRDVRDFFRGEMDDFEFIDDMVRLIGEQFQKAWYEGMRNVGLDPKDDMTPEWRAILDDRIAAEEEFILDFAQAIVDARNVEGSKPSDFYDRVDMWVNRYPEVVALAEITCGGEKRFEWVLGKTEQHCSTCFALSGIVATGEEWEESGYHPQGAPNDKLECGGWRCDCSLQITDKPRTKGGIPNV